MHPDVHVRLGGRDPTRLSELPGRWPEIDQKRTRTHAVEHLQRQMAEDDGIPPLVAQTSHTVLSFRAEDRAAHVGSELFVQRRLVGDRGHGDPRGLREVANCELGWGEARLVCNRGWRAEACEDFFWDRRR